MTYEFIPKGVCSKKIVFSLTEDNVISQLRFEAGCQGNLSGISRLVVGMQAEQVIERLKGTVCGIKGTSCPDQLSCALEKALAQKNQRK